MPQHDPRVDAYIARSAPFARPIPGHVRALVHEACPGVQETIKWGAPSFVHAGGILAGMAAFRQHASFGYWKHALVVGADAARDGMGGTASPRASLTCRRANRCSRTSAVRWR